MISFVAAVLFFIECFCEDCDEDKKRKNGRKEGNNGKREEIMDGWERGEIIERTKGSDKCRRVDRWVDVKEGGNIEKNKGIVERRMWISVRIERKKKMIGWREGMEEGRKG